ncbi:MAG TPA: hypothetical protein VI248_08235 [Kineosporiaceae bacterium]
MTTTHRAVVPSESVPATAVAGAEGNERLTAWTGAALLLGFGAEGLTILDVRWYLKWHILIGYALLVPVALKVATTGYRFARYYTNAPAYRRKGPPRLLLRILGPFMIILTVAVLLTGVGLMVTSGQRHQLEVLHKVSFIAWFGVTSIHVLAYVWRLPQLMIRDLLGRGTPRSAALQRVLLSVGSGAAGLALGVVLLPWITSYVGG